VTGDEQLDWRERHFHMLNHSNSVYALRDSLRALLSEYSDGECTPMQAQAEIDRYLREVLPPTK
jgi:hypothetical protein